MKEELLRIFSDYLEDIDYLAQEQKLTMMQLGAQGEKLISFWYECLKCVDERQEKAELEERDLSFYMDGKCHLRWDKKEIILQKQEAKELFIRMIDLFEPIHPLGTVLELKEEFTKTLPVKDQTQKVKVVVVERFAATSDKQAYFPYVGVVYPVGLLGHGKFLHFTSTLIDSVIQEGYRDDMENAYVLLMKKELLLDNDAVSFGFLTKEEAHEYEGELGVVRHGTD